MSNFFQPGYTAKKSAVPKESKHTVDPENQPWIEKYRPKTIEDVSSQEHTVAVLRKTLTSTNLPHMLFYGPPGTGKTSTILALSRQLFGPDNFRSRVLELNASDERGIAIVREKIKNFARQTPRAQAVASDGKTYPCPPYKIIILDEADSMTQDAQAALRRIMETYARITRFCLVCNYVTRIIEPLASRCSKFRFKPLDGGSTSARLEHIAAAESLDITPAVIQALISSSQGDLRRAITYLQSAARLNLATKSAPNASADKDHSEGETGTPDAAITPRDIQEIAGVVPDEVINSFATALGIEIVGADSGMEVDNTPNGRNPTKGFDGVRQKVRELMREGYPASQLLTQVSDINHILRAKEFKRIDWWGRTIQLHDVVVVHPTLTARQKARCALVFAEADKALCDGADEELWILEVGLKVHKAVSS